MMEEEEEKKEMKTTVRSAPDGSDKYDSKHIISWFIMGKRLKTN